MLLLILVCSILIAVDADLELQNIDHNIHRFQRGPWTPHFHFDDEDGDGKVRCETECGGVVRDNCLPGEYDLPCFVEKIFVQKCCIRMECFNIGGICRSEAKQYEMAIASTYCAQTGFQCYVKRCHACNGVCIQGPNCPHATQPYNVHGMSCKCLTGETCCLLESTNNCESHTDCWGRCVHEADKCLPDETECVDEPCTCKFGDKCCLKECNPSGIDECALRFPGRALCRPHGCKVGVETPVTVVPGLCGPDCHCCKRSGSCSDCGGECRTACWPGEISQKQCDCTAAGHHCCVAQTRGGIHGSPNYTSFDGSKFEYHGTCSYVLFRECTTDPQFVVITDHMNGQDTEDHYRSYVVNVRIILASTRIDITSNDVKVNDMSVTGILPMTTDEGVHINIGYEYKLVHVDFPEVFSLSWNGRDNIIATIDEDFHGYVCGLLGDADGDPRNDMMMILPDGLFELTNDDNEFGNNWEVPGSCNIRRAP